jgi:hypothetical protein
MRTSTPAITVLMCVYNAASFLNEAINSIRNQNFCNFEFLVINDGSTDGSAAILERHALEDSRIRLIHQDNLGLIAALNRGIEEARAPFIARMDGDDVALPDRLEKQWRRMSVEQNLGLLGGHIRLINEQGDAGVIIRFPVGAQEISQRIYYGSPVAHPAVMMRTDLVRKVGGYRNFYMHCEDYDLWLRLSECTHIDNLDEVVLLYRRHDTSISANNQELQTTGTFLAQAAWLIRRSGNEDPTQGWTAIDRQLLLDLPLQSTEKWRLLCRWTMATIENAPAEKTTDGQGLLKNLLDTPGQPRNESSSDLFTLYGKLAHNAWRVGNIRLSFLYGAQCFRHKPIKLIREAIARIL